MRAGGVLIPDAHLLFSGDFKRAGVDLILSDAQKQITIRDYFRGEKHQPLYSPDGAYLTGDVVSALAGYTQFAQADGGASIGKIIGHVTKVAGSATAIRNGVSIILNLGDNVEKGDVVQSGSDSTLALTFIDGTVFGLASNARMVLNEMIYDPNGSNNSSLLSLVAGTITFVAGATAKHGDMKVDTPVATMGIRGTAVLVQIDFLVPGQGGTPDANFQVLVERDGTSGSYLLLDRTTLNPFATVDRPGQQVSLSHGVVSYSTASPFPAEVQRLIDDVFTLKFTDANPKSLNHFTDSIISDGIPHLQLASGEIIIPTMLIANATGTSSSSTPSIPFNPLVHLDVPPEVAASGAAFTVRSSAAHRSGFDTVSGGIFFSDVNRGDSPTVKVKFDSFKVLDAQHNDITSSLTAQQLAEIAAVEAGLVLVPSPGNNNVGSATWTYSVADKAFNFLSFGETLQLTYLAEVDTNYPPYNTVVLKPFTITISSPNVVEWIHPTDGLWSVGSNWKTGLVPTALDDVIIPAADIVGGTGHYAVTIVAPAEANAVILDADNTTGAQLINKSTLTIGDVLTLLNDSVLNNSGTASIDLIELLNQSSMKNSGLIQLLEGGDLAGQSTVSNNETGTLELLGGTLNVLVDVANAGLLQINPNAILTLSGAAIDGGTVTNDGVIDLVGAAALKNGSLGNFGQFNVSASGNSLDGETVSNIGMIDVTGELTLDLGTVITGGNLTNSGLVKIETASGATLDGVDVENGTGIIQVDSIFSPTASTLVVDNGTIITGGTLTIGPVGTFEVATVLGATLDGVSLGNSGVVQVDAGSALNLFGTVITGGIVNDHGTIHVTGNSAIDDAAVNGGHVTVDATKTLTLDGTTVTGAVIADNGTVKVDAGNTLNLSGVLLSGGAISNLGYIDITGDSSISSDALSNNLLTIDSTRTLTLNGTIITGGTVTDNGIIHVTGDSAINDAAIVGGQIIVDDGFTLTLNGTTVTNTVIVDDGAIQIDVNQMRFLDGVALGGGTINNLGTLEIIGDSSISNDVLNNNQLTIDAGKTLTLSETTVIGGTITDDGTIEIAGDSTINGQANLNGGQVTIDAFAQLTLDDVTVTGTAIADNGTLKVDAFSTLDLSGVAVSGGAIANLGLIDVIGDSSITNDTLTNSGTLRATLNSTLELADTTVANTGGAVTVDAGSTLDLDGGDSITGGTLGNAGTVDATGTNALHSMAITNAAGATLESTGGVLTIDAGSIISNAGLLEANGGDLVLTSDTLTNTNTLKATLNSTVELTNTTVTNTGGAVTVDAGSTLDLDGGDSITGGTLGNAGTVDATGTNALHSMAITNAAGATLESTGGVLTIDAGSIISNAGLLEANGGDLVLTNDTLTNTNTLKATLNSTVELTNTTVTNTGGVVTVDAGSTLDLDNGASITDGTLGNAGEVNAEGSTGLHHVGITNSGTMESTGGLLTIDAGSTINNAGTLQANGGELDLTNDTLTNTNKLRAINNSILELTNTTVANTGGVVTIDAGSTLDLDGGDSITGGTLGNAGTVDATGTNALHSMAITNAAGATLESAGGVLTIDAGSIISNAGLLETNGGDLVLTNDTLTNTNTLKATLNSTVELTSTTVTNTGGVVTVDAGSTLDLDGGASITGGTLGNAGTVDATGTNALHSMAITNAAGATLESTGGVLTIDAGSIISNAGLLEANGGDLVLTSDTLTNTNTLKATLNSTVELTNTTVTNTGGAVTVDAGSTLDLDGGDSITGGTLGNAGTVDATGTNALHSMAITNAAGATLESTGGVLTIDAGSIISNAGLLEANGGDLVLTNDTLTNTNTLKATLNSTVELTNTTVTNTGGAVTVDAGSTLDLDNGASITDGTLGNAGEVNAEGSTGLHHVGITNSGTMESTGGLLTIDAGSTINNTGTLQANGGELDLTNDTLTNTNKLRAINNSILELTNTTVANTGGVVTIDAGSTLDLDGGDSITGGTLGNAGEVNAEGSTGLHHIGITNSGTMESTGGLLTIDAGSTINNAGMLQANGGELDLTDDTLTNTNTLKAINNSTLELTNTIVANLGGAITVLGGSTLDLDNGASISDGTLGNAGEVNAEGSTGLHHVGITNSGTLESTSGLLTIDAGSTIGNFGTLQANGGELDLTNDTLTNTGTLKARLNSILELTNTTVANVGGTVTIDVGSTLDLDNGASISDGTLGNAGEVNAEGSTGLHHIGITNSGTMESTGGLLTIDAGSTIGNSGTLQANGGELDLTNDTLTNTGTLKARLNSILELTNTTVANVGGTVTIDVGSTLDLDNGASISDGTLDNAGEVNAEGSTGLHHVGISNTGKLESTGGLLTIDGGSTINNSGTVQANGGELDLTNDTLTNTNTLKVTASSTLKLTGTTVTNAGGTVMVDAGSTLTLATSTITDGLVIGNTNGAINLNGLAVFTNGSLSNSGQISVNGTGNALHHETVTANHMLEILSGGALLVDQGSTIANGGGTVMVDVGGSLTLNSATITGGTVANYGTIYAITTVDIFGNIIGTGAINIANLAELEIGGSFASTNTVFFSGSQSELILDHSMQFSGLITGSSVGTLLTLDDQIDLRDLPFNLNNMSTTVSYSSNVSTVTFIEHNQTGDISVQIQLSGDYTNQGWRFTNDSYGGSLVQLAPPPVFSDIIDNNQYAFTGHKTTPGNMWTFQAAVTDDDANVIGQGGITKFDLYDTSDNGTTLLGSATFDGGTWTVSGLLSSVSYAGGIYTVTTTITTEIKNGDILEITAYDAANLSASKFVTLTTNSSFNVAPAGIARDPINLALTDPSGGQLTGPIQLTFTGVPSDWSINEGTNLGNGTWTVETSHLSALTVTTAAAYTGAMVLSVTETWTNADGSTGIAVVSDNVEAYAPGSPIFALSGNDTLTGAGGNDLFVFAQAIGHDTVYSFDVGHDQIDLIGYAGFTSFADIQAHLTEDANGNALITLEDGQSIELQGVHAAALTQSNFVFDQMPTLDNAGTMTIGDGAVMPLSGTIHNTGTIALNSTGDETDLQLIEHGLTLQGGGQIVLSDSDANIISGTSSGVTLNNEDNTISGAGQLGNGELTLTNAGTIDATGTHALTIDTGSNWVFNSGVLEASGSGGLTVASSIANSGVLWANGSTLTVQGQVSGNGTAAIDGTATLDLEASATVNVMFGSGGGTLKLGDAFHFDGRISGFNGADVIDLANVDFGAASISYHENAAGTGGTLTISEGTQVVALSLLGDYSADNFRIAPDHVKGTSITYVPHDLIV
ncbi:hypothetical protein [Bradyrhizobium sp. AZCC 2289]|uniref:hypothetical protein n=1 Tax=Bradyrhizobium sp. AZCC 2289 TaxID=3117026 RepID=UPI002FEEF600